MSKLIYIVEDDEMMASYLKRVLKKYTVEIFSNGIDAIAAVDNIIPDLVILDIILNGPSGFAFMNEMQSYADTCDTPMIICSSMAEEIGNMTNSKFVMSILDKTSMTPEGIRSAVRRVLDE